MSDEEPEMTIDARRFAGAWANAVRVKLIYPNAGEPVYSGSSIGRKLSPEHQEIIDRARAESIRRLEERRKRQD